MQLLAVLIYGQVLVKALVNGLLKLHGQLKVLVSAISFGFSLVL